ncbi:hypothetical protein CATMQ487_19320 [Sphaerotilus microaerophilus]|uniref:PKD domain-containing protein n=1 Tax=Sphaerotilus microaerophilus TaxID=2914710 RepID=A0ABM7YKL3_9BURK|nr:hypothetical protein CATMQ487_19320 [Sphaerotilus sp. FB-5]
MGGCAQPAPPRIQRIATLPSLLGALALLGAGLLLPASVSAERGPSRSSASLPADTGDTARVIVKYRSSSSSGTASALSAQSGGTAAALAAVQRAAALSSRLGLKLSNGPAVGPRHQVLTATGMSSEALAAQLGTDSEVEYAVPSRKRRAHAVTPSDPRYAGSSSQSPAAGQWYLRTPDSTFVSSVDAPAAWAVSTGNASVVVAVLDTGVRRDHPDLTGKLLAGYDFVSSSSISNDGDGRDADPSDPGDWVSAAEASTGTFSGCSEASSSWHGTQTAGLVAAATNNGMGMAALGRNVRVLPVRVLGKCFGYDDDIIAGIRWAAGLTVAGVPTNPNPAKVISLSLGSAGSCDSAYQEAVREAIAAGASVVVSAGNDSLAVNAPANCAGAIAVAGVRHVGTKIGYSSLGPEVTIAAPGGNCVNDTGECLYPISSTSNTGSTIPLAASYTSGGDDYAVGTSFSAPQVSAAIGLMLSANPTLTPSQVTSLLQDTARTFPTTGASSDPTVSTDAACLAPSAAEQARECYCTTATCGAGMLDAGAAVKAAAAGRLVANIVDDSSLIAVGASGAFSAAQSSASTGNRLSAYGWGLTSGSSIASLGSSTGSSTRLTATGDGTVLLQLTVTDASGSATTTAVVSIGKGGSVDGSTTDTGEGDDSGGGAIGGELLLGGSLAAAVLVLIRRRERQTRC